MISIIGPACNTTAGNTLISLTCVELQDKKRRKKLCSFRSVIKSKSMDTQVFVSEEIPDLLLLEMEVHSVISGVETDVSKYEIATNLVILGSNSDLDMSDDVCDVGHDF